MNHDEFIGLIDYLGCTYLDKFDPWGDEYAI